MFDESDKHRYEAQLKINEDLRNENLRLREAVKSAMREIVNEDFDEVYHQLYKGLDPKFENLFGVDIEKAV